MRAVLVMMMCVACDGGEGDDSDPPVDRVADVLALTGDSARGATVWDDECLQCHTVEVAEIFGGRPIDSQVRSVLTGPGGMPPFDGVIPDQEIADVVAFMSSF